MIVCCQQVVRTSISGQHLLEYLTLFDQRRDFVLGIRACFQQNPPAVIHVSEQIHQLLIRIVSHVQLSHMDGVTETVLDEVEVVLKAFTIQVDVVRVPADG